jgi:hypothetical protein
MKVTAILKDFSEKFYIGAGESIPAFMDMDNRTKWEEIKRMGHEKRVSIKIGSGQFRDTVELNQILRQPVNIDFKIEPRRGYKLATFNIEKA